MTANPPVWGVGVECNVRSFGWANIERNDFAEHKLLVINQADTKANRAGNMTITTCLPRALSHETTLYEFVADPTLAALRYEAISSGTVSANECVA